MSLDGQREFEMALDGLMSALSPAGRRQVGLRLAQVARRANQRRIAANVAPSGAAFAPRLRQKGNKAKRGRMFKGLRQARHLRLVRGGDDVRIEFTGRTGRIAAVHHFGQRDKVTPGGTEVRYTARPLLGFSAADIAAMEDLLLDHIAAGRR